VKKFIVLILVVTALSSCNNRYASNGEKLYLSSRNGPALQIPPPLTSSNISHFYDLPPPKGDVLVYIAPPIDKAD